MNPVNSTVAVSLVAWLTGLGNNSARDAVAVCITIKGKDYYGARYRHVNHYTEGMRCVQEGKHKAGEEYSDVRYYMLGIAPLIAKALNREGECKNVLRFPGDDGDWYMGGGIEEIEPRVREFHPFGPNWAISRWPHEDFKQRIDHYDGKPRNRIEATVS